MKKITNIFKKAVVLCLLGVMAINMLMTGGMIKASATGSTTIADVPIDAAHFPDEAFRNYVDKYFDSKNDGKLSEEEIKKVTKIDIYDYDGIYRDYKGIEYFTYLEELYCDDVHNLAKLDVSKNVNLKVLSCNKNKVTELDLSKNVNLEKIEIGGCDISQLDLSNCVNLKELFLIYLSITGIDLSSSTKLESCVIMYCDGLKSVDFSNNINLKFINASYTGISELDVSNNVNLEKLYCDDVQELTKLDITNNVNLSSFTCSNNQITELDLSNNPKLTYLDCSNNQLTELDLSNNPNLETLYCDGNNISVLNIGNNPNLDEDKSKLPTGDVTIIRKSVKSITLNKTTASLKKGDTLQLTATVAPSDADMKTVLWSSSNPKVATVDAKGLVTVVGVGNATITATAEDRSGVSASCVIETPMPAASVSYRTHIQSYGWEGTAGDINTWKKNGAMSGTSGKAKRLEGINVVVNSADPSVTLDLGIQYTTHCQSYGWLPWSANGEMNGTEGEAKRLEAIKIQLTGSHAQYYDVYYRVHAQSYGWLGWAKDGAPAGTAGFGKRLEGIQIVIVKKDESFNQKMENITSARAESFVANAGESPIVNYPATSNTNPVVPGADSVNVAYRTHVQSFGWQAWKYNGQMSGTSGKAKRLEGINIELRNKAYSGDIVYTTHVQSYGWQGKLEDQSTWKKNGQMSGTSGEAKRLEAICINLTGEMAQKYDIYYRVHAQSYGWLGWAKNGAPAGTAGYAKRLEGIQIVLVPKGGAAPGNYQGITSANSNPYISK